jgi:hypothetical protein
LLHFFREVSFKDKILISESAQMNFNNHLYQWTTLVHTVEVFFFFSRRIKILMWLKFYLKTYTLDLVLCMGAFHTNSNWKNTFIIFDYLLSKIVKFKFWKNHCSDRLRSTWGSTVLNLNEIWQTYGFFIYFSVQQ